MDYKIPLGYEHREQSIKILYREGMFGVRQTKRVKDLALQNTDEFNFLQVVSKKFD